jgi:hypothetical protein
MINEALDEFGFSRLRDTRRTQRTHDPHTLDPIRDQRADADNLVEDQLRELLPELLACGSLIGFVESIDACNAREVGDGLQVENEDVIKRAELETTQPQL